MKFVSRPWSEIELNFCEKRKRTKWDWRRQKCFWWKIVLPSAKKILWAKSSTTCDLRVNECKQRQLTAGEANLHWVEVWVAIKMFSQTLNEHVNRQMPSARDLHCANIFAAIIRKVYRSRIASTVCRLSGTIDENFSLSCTSWMGYQNQIKSLKVCWLLRKFF